MIKKYHPVISAAVSIAFIVMLQTFAAPSPVFRFLLPAVLVFICLLQLYHWTYLKAINKFSKWQILSSALFYFGWFGVFMLLPNAGIRGVFLLLSLPVVYLLEFLISNHGEHLIHAKVLLTMLVLIYSLVGFQYYYQVSTTLILLLSFVTVYLIVQGSFELVPTANNNKLLISLCIALFLTEFFWALMFLPFHYSVIALALFNFFYVCWSLTYYYLFNKISRKRIQFHVGLALFLTIFLIFLTQWSL